MAATIARATGVRRVRRVKETHRLGSQHACAEANTWRTFTTTVVAADGSGWVRVTRDGVTLHHITFGAGGPGRDRVMMVDTTVYGYISDGGVSCPRCVGPKDDATANRIYSLDDADPEGLSCDGCGKYIFEPSWSDLWEQAINDILTYNKDESTWRKASRILDLFREADFDPKDHFPDR